MLQRREDDSAADVEWFESADCITAGFPCQDISLAGKCAGLAGERSGLWWQARRAIRMVRPRIALLENVAALLNRGMGTVLGSMASIGYDAEWHCISLAHLGGPCVRDRIVIVAVADKDGRAGVQKPNILAETRISTPRRHHVDGLDLAQQGPWSSLPDILRVDYGLPGTLDRLGAIGNAFSPAHAAAFGEAILENMKP